MQFKLTLALLGALFSLAKGDDCDPLKSADCSADTALGSSFKEDFSSKSKYFSEVESLGLLYSDTGLEFNLSKRLENPTIKSNFYIMFGKIEVVMKAAKGTGIVSSFYLQSDDLDEIDIELLGGDTTQYQSNYFSKGNTSTYDRGEYHSTPKDPTENYLTYTIDWQKDNLTWSVNGEQNRILQSTNSQGYPQTPMFIKAGVWAGGDSSNDEGTIEWAGGSTDYSDAPFCMYIKSLIVTDYSTGKKYSYSDQSGDWSSIKAEDGKVYGRYEQAIEDFEKLADGESISTSAFSAESDIETGTALSSLAPSSSSVSATASKTSETSSSITSSSSESSGYSSSAIPSSTESSSSADSKTSLKSATKSSNKSLAADATTASSNSKLTSEPSTHSESSTSSLPLASESLDSSGSGAGIFMNPLYLLIVNTLSLLYLI